MADADDNQAAVVQAGAAAAVHQVEHALPAVDEAVELPIPHAELDVRPITSTSIVEMLEAAIRAQYRAVRDVLHHAHWKDALARFRDALLMQGLPSDLDRRHKDFLQIIMNEFGISSPTSWNQDSKFLAQGAAIAPMSAQRKEAFVGERRFEALVGAGFYQSGKDTVMADCMVQLEAQAENGLCEAAAVLFLGVGWVHKDQTLADTAARSRQSFLRVELAKMHDSYSADLSRGQRLQLTLAHTHAAGACLWHQDLLSAWDQTFAWIQVKLLAPLMQRKVSVMELEDLLVRVVFPAMGRRTLAVAQTALLTDQVADLADFGRIWTSSVPADVLATTLRNLVNAADRRALTSSATIAGQTSNELRTSFKSVLEIMAHHALPLNWGDRAASLRACPLHLFSPGLCPMDAVCPLGHDFGEAWQDASEHVFGSGNVVIDMLRQRLANLEFPYTAQMMPLPDGVPQSAPGSSGGSSTRRGARGSGRGRGRGRGGRGNQSSTPPNVGKTPEATGNQPSTTTPPTTAGSGSSSASA